MAAAEKNQRKSKTVPANSGRGGRRPGAGRPKGSATKRTREIADKAAAEGVTPLEYMLQIMRRPTAHEDPKVEVARETLAFEAAKAAAPYIHPRLAAVEHTGADGKDLMPAAPVINVTVARAQPKE